MKAPKPLSEKILWLIKNNRFFACVIVFGVIVISIGAFTDAVKKITYFISKESPEDARIKLAQMKISFEPAIFRKCIEDSDINCVKLFLSAGMDPNTKTSSDDYSLLTCAVRQGDREIIETLMNARADINDTTGPGWGPLSYAARTDKKDILLILLKYKPDVKTLNAAFVEAASNGAREIMDILIKRGADLKMVEDEESTLDWALNNAIDYSATVNEKDTVGIIKYLLELGANVNNRYSRNKIKKTPLLLAVEKRSDAIANILLDNGADPNARWECNCAYQGMTPLMLAVKNDQIDLAETLLDKGASINVDLNNSYNNKFIAGGSTAMMMSVRNSGMAKMLINRGADLNIIDNKGRSLLSLAAECNNPDILKILIDNGLDVNHKDNSGNTPLMYASENYKDDSLQVLLDNGADVNLKNNRGEISLMFAVDDHYCENSGHVLALLDKGSEINLGNDDGKTALMIAAQRGCINFVKLLLERGADMNQKDNFGKTAQDFAEKSELTGEGRDNMLGLLSSNRASLN